MRCAVLPPVAVPYREPLFAALAERSRLELRVIYQSGAQPGWDQRADWFPDRHAYDAEVLTAHQHERAGRTPVLFPRALGRALSRFDPDCVVSWEYGASTLRAFAWCRRRGRPLVAFSELTPAVAAELSPGRGRLQVLLAPRLDGFIAASSAARERLLGLGVAPERIEVSLQSADLHAVRAAVERRGPRRDGPLRLLSVGRLVPDKNHTLLLQAFADAGRDSSAELVVCGSGPLEEALRRQATEDGLRVEFPGYVPPAKLPELYAGADAFVLVSTFEPFGAAVREAAAAGLPLICSRRAGAAGDLAVEGENALLVDPDSRGEVAAALGRLIGDADLRRRLAAGSLAVTERHPLAADVEAFERAVLRAGERD